MFRLLLSSVVAGRAYLQEQSVKTRDFCARPETSLNHTRSHGTT